MNLDAALDLLAREPNAPIDLAEVSLHLARDEYPELDIEAHLQEFHALAHEARRFLGHDLQTSVQGLCRYLFHELGFRGNQRDYYDPRNSYLHLVVERRTGIPISLSAVAIAVGRRVGLDIVGVGLPGHFIVKARGEGQEILFDPFHGGRILSLSECAILVEQVTGREFEASAEALQPLPLGLLVQRMLNNLKGIYLGSEDFPRAIRVMERLRQLRPEDVSQRRDLGSAYLRAQQPGKAIDHLREYLRQHDDAHDADGVRTLLREAERILASWN